MYIDDIIDGCLALNRAQKFFEFTSFRIAISNACSATIFFKKKKPSVWTDLLLFNFVVATILVAGAIWPYPMLWY
jgi:hypothetical protein